MRVILAIAIGLAFATTAAAQTVPDRYGPPRAGVQTASAAQAMAYGGRMLSWASKVEPAPAVAPRAPEPAAPQAQAPQPRRELMASRAYTLGEIEQAPEPQPAHAAAPPARPASLYDTPAPRTAAAAPQPAPVAAPPAPVRVAAAPTAAPMAAPGGGAPTRLYSLHREYGMAPDPTPQVPAGERYVLVGPPDAPQPAPDGAKADDGQDRPF